MVSGKKCYWNEEVSPRNSASPAGVHHLIISNNPFYPIPFPRMEKIQFTPTLPKKSVKCTPSMYTGHKNRVLSVVGGHSSHAYFFSSLILQWCIHPSIFYLCPCYDTDASADDLHNSIFYSGS